MILLLCTVYANKYVYSFDSSKDNTWGLLVFYKSFIVGNGLSEKIAYSDVKVYFY